MLKFTSFTLKNCSALYQHFNKFFKRDWIEPWALANNNYGSIYTYTRFEINTFNWDIIFFLRTGCCVLCVYHLSFFFLLASLLLLNYPGEKQKLNLRPYALQCFELLWNGWSEFISCIFFTFRKSTKILTFMPSI